MTRLAFVTPLQLLTMKRRTVLAATPVVQPVNVASSYVSAATSAGGVLPQIVSDGPGGNAEISTARISISNDPDGTPTNVAPVI